ncbi:MAG TPA: metallophosphoesterase [Nitrososphaeraceae archaeon]|nr:metallophosphoesterase [Nitrososphaeraceae archaeon]
MAQVQDNSAITTTTGATPSANPNFNFAALGDTNCNSNTEDIVEDIQTKAAELVLGLGDYIYNDDEAACWLEIVEPIDDKVRIAIGNHETGAILTELMEHYGLTEQYYSFDYQNVHFTVMSDYVSDEIGSEQYAFVQNDLAKAAADPNIDWIVLVHHSQKYAATTNYDIPDENEWNIIYHPLFEQYNVDLVLQGHQHNYQRTYPIMYNDDSPANPIITDRNKNTYTNPEGQIYLTVGTGGAGLHKLNGNQAPYTVTAQDEEHGYLNVDVTPNNGGTTLVGTFYSSDDGVGQMTDQFTITKSGAEDSSRLPPPPPPPPDIPIQQTDGIGEADDDGITDIDLDDAVVSEDGEDVDATDDGDDGGDDGDDGGEN